MRAAGVSDAARAAFRHRYEQLIAGSGGELPGDQLEPVPDVPALGELAGEIPDAAIDSAAIVKLNGGLGTSMGLSGPKSLIEVKPEHSFLDVIPFDDGLIKRKTVYSDSVSILRQVGLLD